MSAILEILTRRYPGLGTALLVICSCLASVTALEVGYRAYIRWVPGRDPRLVAVDAELGWLTHPAPLPRAINACGETVDRRPPAGRYLLRAPARPGKLRVLFIGDSFTHAHNVSTGAAYYDLFEELMDGRVSVYAAGVGGYGSVQELMLLRKVLPEVRPDLLVWQLTPNDVTENVWELNVGSGFSPDA